MIVPASERELVCDFPAGWPLTPLPPPFFNSIRTSRVMMIMMMVTMIITVTIFTPIFAGSESVSRVKCQVQSRALAADPCRFVFPPRHLGEAASIRPSDRSQGTAAISGSQYNASPVPSEPTMQNADRKPEHLPPRMAPREEGRGRGGDGEANNYNISDRVFVVPESSVRRLQFPNC